MRFLEECEHYKIEKNFPTHGGTHKLEKIQQAFWKETKP